MQLQPHGFSNVAVQREIQARSLGQQIKQYIAKGINAAIMMALMQPVFFISN